MRERGRTAASLARMLPDILLLGGQKCGTSSLHHYLVQHPDVGAPRLKEVHYFDVNADRSELWYRSHFPRRGLFPHAVDSSPYYIYHPAVPRRAHRLLPDAKLIVLLREPVKRTYSHYHHAFRLGLETLSFEDAIAQEEERLAGTDAFLLSSRGARSDAHRHQSYVSRSVYAPQIARWYEHFDRSQFLFLTSEDLFTDPATTVERVHSWLGLSPAQPTDLAPMNVGSYQPLEGPMADQLAERFAADRVEVERLTGMTLPWPSR